MQHEKRREHNGAEIRDTKIVIHDFTVWNILPPSKVVLHVITQKNHKIFSQLSATYQRLVTGTGHREHISPVLRRLHWLPVQQRVELKLALLIHKLLIGQLSPYLADDCQLIADSSRRTLRSSVTATFVVPRTNSTFCDRSFAVAGSRIWNSLPTSLRSVDLTTDRFKRASKTFLFVWDRGTSVTLFKARRI